MPRGIRFMCVAFHFDHSIFSWSSTQSLDIRKMVFGDEYDGGYESGFTTRSLLQNFLIIRNNMYTWHMPVPYHGWLTASKCSYWNRGSIYIRSYREKKSLRVISKHFDILSTQLLGDKDLSLLRNNHLWHVASEHRRVNLDAKEKAAFSFKYLFTYLFDIFYQSGQPTNFSCSLQI